MLIDLPHVAQLINGKVQKPRYSGSQTSVLFMPVFFNLDSFTNHFFYLIFFTKVTPFSAFNLFILKENFISLDNWKICFACYIQMGTKNKNENEVLLSFSQIKLPAEDSQPENISLLKKDST